MDAGEVDAWSVGASEDAFECDVGGEVAGAAFGHTLPVPFVELSDFRTAAVCFEPGGGFLARVVGAFFAGEARDEVGNFVRVVIALLQHG